MSILKDKFEATWGNVFSDDSGFELEIEIKRGLVYLNKTEIQQLIQELTELKDKMI